MNEGYDKIIYWGFRHYGRHDARDHFRLNKKSVVQMGLGSPVTMKWEYHNNTQDMTVFYKHEDSDILSKCETFEYTKDDMFKLNQPHGIKHGCKMDMTYDYLGYGKFLERNREEKNIDKENEKQYMKNYRKIGAINKSKERVIIYHAAGEEWDQHFFNDLTTCDLFIPTYYDTLFEYQPFVDYLRTCNNIVPYKSDLIDMNISRLQLMMVDLQTVSRDKIYHTLDHYITCNRLVETKLREHNIPYEYFDLDTEDFDKWVDELLPRTDGYGWGAYPFDKTTERYEIAERISQQYIFTRRLSDVRLDGRITDKI